MKSLELAPNIVITPSIWIDVPEKLEEYYQLISRGQTKSILPVTVMSPDQYPIEKYEACLKKNELGFDGDKLENELVYAYNLGRDLDCWLSPANGAKYLLCDGNHRSVAFVLHGMNLPARQIKTFKDITTINKEFKERGDLGPAIMRENKSLEEYFFRMYRAIINRTMRKIEGKVEELMDSKELRIEDGHVIYEPYLPF